MIKKFSPHQPHSQPAQPQIPSVASDQDDFADTDELAVEDVGYHPPSAAGQAPLITSNPSPTQSYYYAPDSSLSRDLTMKKNILANDVEIKGTIKFDDELIFDGKIEGEFQSEGTLILGENSDVHGEVKTKSVSLSGRVQGNITVEEKCELKGRAQLIGDLKAARLVIEEGATFVGRSEVTPNRGGMPKGDGFRFDEAKGSSGGR